MQVIPHLPVGRYRAHFDCPAPARSSDFPANAWRGALGHALKRTVCVTRQADCRACLLYCSCLYPYFWDTPPHPGAEKMRKYETAPHPFVLIAEPEHPEQLEFHLLGHANRHLAVFLHALAQAAANPRGIAGNIMALSRLEQTNITQGDDWQTIFRPGEPLAALPARSPEIPPPPAHCRLEILTPLRVKRQGRHVGPQDFQFADLFGNLLRRISMLTYFHTDTPFETDFKGLMETARQISSRARLEWREHTRYSKRQEMEMQMGGVIGALEIDAADLAPFWPCLWLGQYLHAGNGATMGLGRYRIAASLPNPH